MSQQVSGNKFSRRQFLQSGAAFGATIGLAALAACAPPPAGAPAATGGAAPAAAASKVIFWKPPHTPKEPEIWKPLLQKFMDANPGITVEHQVVPWANVSQQFTAAFAGGSPPDIFYLPDEWYPKYVSDDQIADLTDKISSWKDKYTEAGWHGATYKGKTWGVPFLGVAEGWLCNMKLFKAKGLTPPTSWEEFRAAAKALTDTAAGTYGVAPFVNGWSNWIIYIPLLATAGASLLNEDLTKFAANTEGGVAALKTLYEDIVWTDKVATPLSFTDDQNDSLFIQGKVGMQWVETARIKSVLRQQAPDMAIEAVPMLKLNDKGKNGSWANIGFMFMSKQAADNQSAFKLLEYLSTDDIQVDYVEKGVDLLPLKKNIAPVPDADPVVTEIVSWLGKGWGVGTTISIRWLEANNIMKQEVQSILTGQKSAADALKSIEQAVNPILDGQ